MRIIPFALLALASCVEDTRPPTAPLLLVDSQPAPVVDDAYTRVVERVAAMVHDDDLAARVSRRGLRLVNVTWEDTGRAQGSAVGPNISDFTLQVRHAVATPLVSAWSEDETPSPLTRWETTLMPVIRTPNFEDITGDVPADRFFVRVGNAGGKELQSVPLLDVIRDLGRFASSAESLNGGAGRLDLSAPRDTHFLVSAQALFLPIPTQNAAEFNPVLFNYESVPGSPAVLAILATREGTSMTVIENRGTDRGLHWGQELYFNAGGKRAYFTAERRSDVAARIASRGGPRNEAERSMLGRGADVMAMIQIPLVHDNRGVLGGMGYSYSFSDDPLSTGGFARNDATVRFSFRRSDVERAVLGHGVAQGSFQEGYGTKLVRDPQFPIRITVQFYKATSTGEASDADLDAILTSIQSVYAHADYVGSLVLPAGDARRPTAWQHVPGEWFPW